MSGFSGGALFMVAGCLVFYVILIRGLVGHVRMRRNAVRVPGVVRELRQVHPLRSRVPQYAPVLEFRTLDGRVVQTESPVHSNPAVAQPGDSVQVAYDPTDPTEAHVDTVGGSGVLVFAAGLAITTLVFVIVLAILLNSL